MRESNSLDETGGCGALSPPAQAEGLLGPHLAQEVSRHEGFTPKIQVQGRRYCEGDIRTRRAHRFWPLASTSVLWNTRHHAFVRPRWVPGCKESYTEWEGILDPSHLLTLLLTLPQQQLAVAEFVSEQLLLGHRQEQALEVEASDEVQPHRAALEVMAAEAAGGVEPEHLHARAHTPETGSAPRTPGVEGAEEREGRGSEAQVLASTHLRRLPLQDVVQILLLAEHHVLQRGVCTAGAGIRA